MLMYLLIGLSLVLLGICGLQFMYLFYIERVFNERKEFLRSLEARNRDLQDRLLAAERRLIEQGDLLNSAYSNRELEDEVWADVIWEP